MLQICFEFVHLIEQCDTSPAHDIVRADDHHIAFAHNFRNLGRELCLGGGSRRFRQQGGIDSGIVSANVAFLLLRNVAVGGRDRHARLIVDGLLLDHPWLVARNASYTDGSTLQETVDLTHCVHLHCGLLLLLLMMMLLRLVLLLLLMLMLNCRCRSGTVNLSHGLHYFLHITPPAPPKLRLVNVMLLLPASFSLLFRPAPQYSRRRST